MQYWKVAPIARVILRLVGGIGTGHFNSANMARICKLSELKAYLPAGAVQLSLTSFHY